MNGFKCICFFAFLFLFFDLAKAVTIVEEAPDETQTMVVPSKNLNTGHVFSKSNFDFSIDSVFENASNGFKAYSLFDIHAKSELAESMVNAEGVIRVKKFFSNSDEFDSVDLRLAKVTYFENWLQVAVGRMDMTGIISPVNFFGSYPTMGIRRLDGLSIVLPIRLSFGGEDYKGVNTPPTSISAFYFPTLFSSTYASLNGDQAFLLGQARLRVVADGIQTTFRFNIGGCATDYFTYSSVCGNTTLSASIDSKIAKQFLFYGEYGIQNLALAGTSALALGAKAEDLGTAGPFSLESLILEVQEPLVRDGNNAFTGGNTYIPALAQYPGTTWFAGLKTRIKKVSIEAALTNSVGDYTFARLSPLAVNVPLTVPYGPGNEVNSLYLPLVSSSYNSIAFMITMGTEF